MFVFVTIKADVDNNNLCHCPTRIRLRKNKRRVPTITIQLRLYSPITNRRLGHQINQKKKNQNSISNSLWHCQRRYHNSSNLVVVNRLPINRDMDHRLSLCLLNA